ncbi:MAG: transcription termination/antitermination protein NusG [Planctomycetaceae bacterium]|nr:transcription termination/antitermination protein NusG [Planctomycetaceae bacterium]
MSETELKTDESNLDESQYEMSSEPAEKIWEDDDDDFDTPPPNPKEKAFADEKKERASGKMDWYILKVQVNREDTIKQDLERRIAVSGLQEYFGEILVPSEKITEIRGDKKKIVKRKLYPGYIMIFMEVFDDTWFLVRETAGVGDFTGAQGKPTPMLSHEVERILKLAKEGPEKAPELKVGYQAGQEVKVKDGPFETLEGVVDNIDYVNGRVTVIISIFGRSTPVELEYWQIESVSK